MKVEEGVLTAVSQEVVPLATAKAAVEMMMLGGDHHVLPVTSWDDQPVGTGAAALDHHAVTPANI